MTKFEVLAPKISTHDNRRIIRDWNSGHIVYSDYTFGQYKQRHNTILEMKEIE